MHGAALCAGPLELCPEGPVQGRGVGEWGMSLLTQWGSGSRSEDSPRPILSGEGRTGASRHPPGGFPAGRGLVFQLAVRPQEH